MPRRLAQTSASATTPASAALAPRALKMPLTRARRSSALTRTLLAVVGMGTRHLRSVDYLDRTRLTTALWPPRTVATAFSSAGTSSRVVATVKPAAPAAAATAAASGWAD